MGKETEREINPASSAATGRGFFARLGRAIWRLAKWVVFGFGLIVVYMLIFGADDDDSINVAKRGAPAGSVQETVTAARDSGQSSIDQLFHEMEVVFLGDYDRQQIKKLLDDAFETLDISKTYENYDTNSNILVALRKGSGVQEMHILRCIRSLGVKMDFPAAAALCTAGLETSR